MHIYTSFEMDMVLQISRFFYENLTLITLKDTKMFQNFKELPNEL